MEIWHIISKWSYYVKFPRLDRGLFQQSPRQVEPFVDQSMSLVRNISQKNAQLAIGDLAQGATVLSSHADRLVALLGKSRFVQDENTVRRVQQPTDLFLEPINDRPIRPGRFGQKTLQAARRGTLHCFGDVFGIAPVGLLHQQPTQVLLASLLGLFTPEQRGESLMESGESCRDTLKFN